jgi:hypothetical protein
MLQNTSKYQNADSPAMVAGSVSLGNFRQYCQKLRLSFDSTIEPPVLNNRFCLSLEMLDSDHFRTNSLFFHVEWLAFKAE